MVAEAVVGKAALAVRKVIIVAVIIAGRIAIAAIIIIVYVKYI